MKSGSQPAPRTDRAQKAVRVWHHLICWIASLGVPYLIGVAIASTRPEDLSNSGLSTVDFSTADLVAIALMMSPFISWIGLPFGMLIINRELRVGNANALTVTAGGLLVGMAVTMLIGAVFLGVAPLVLIPSALVGAFMGALHALIYWLTLRLLVPSAFRASSHA